MKKLFAAIALSSALALAAPVVAQDLETIAEFDKRPGNPTVSADGRVFLSMSAFDNPEVNVLEVMPDGTVRVFRTRRGRQNRRIGRSWGSIPPFGCKRSAITSGSWTWVHPTRASLRSSLRGTYRSALHIAAMFHKSADT